MVRPMNPVTGWFEKTAQLETLYYLEKLGALDFLVGVLSVHENTNANKPSIICT